MVNQNATTNTPKNNKHTDDTGDSHDKHDDHNPPHYIYNVDRDIGKQA